MRILFLGDIVGRAGRNAVIERLPELKRRLEPDFIIVNGENAAGGFGLNAKIAQALYDAGVDVITTGNHVWDQKELITHIAQDAHMLRPANFPPGTPGRGAGLYDAGGRQVLVVNLMGRLYMEALDDPFQAIDRELDACPLGAVADAIVIDVHAEATAEKMALAHYVDGRASLVVGTHTHIPTADHQILAGGVAYLSDAGMCGDYDSVIGMEKDEPIHRFVARTKRGRFTPAQGPASICGCLVVTDDATGRASAIAPVRVGGRLEEAIPEI